MAKYFCKPEIPQILLKDVFGITQANLNGFSLVMEISDVDALGGKPVVYAVWATGTITLSNYNAFGIGSVILDVIGGTFNLHNTATTWVSETLT